MLKRIKADNGERQRATVSDYSVEDNEGKNRCRGETKDKYSGVEHYRGESGCSLHGVFCSKDKSRQRSKEWAQQQRETKSNYSTVLNTMERMAQ